MAKVCSICGKPFSRLAGGLKCKNGMLCRACLEKRGLSADDRGHRKMVKSMTAEEVWMMPVRNEAPAAEIYEKMEHFQSTFEVSVYAKFDDRTQTMMLVGPFRMRPKLSDYLYLRYDQITGYQIFTDSREATAYHVGIRHPLYGKTVPLSENAALKRLLRYGIQVVVSLQDAPKAFHCITIKHASASSRTSALNYRTAVEQARQIGDKLQLILDHNDGGTKPADPVDEVRRYKELLDEGIISISEFQKKKKELLGV